MNRSISAIVTEESDGDRVDAFLGSLSSIASRSAAAKLIDAGSVMVNGAVVQQKSSLVYEGDRVDVELPESKTAVLRPQFIPLDIRFEDEYLIVLSKVLKR